MELAVVAKKFVVVAFAAVKFWSVVEPITSRSPAELNVEVAVPPKYAVPKLEKRVVEAFKNCWSAVHMFPCARLSVAVRVPPRVAGVPPIVRVELESERAIVLADRRLVPIVVVETSLPVLSVPKRELVREVKYVLPVLVKLVVLAPPFIERRPEVIVEEALERKPLVNVARPEAASVPTLAACE